MNKMSAFLTSNRRFLPLTSTILLFFAAYALGAIFFDGMRDPQIFLNLFRTSPFMLISAIGMTFVILTGGIDLSVSGVIALTTVASAALLRNKGINPWVVMLLMLGMGMALGAIMGAFITYLKVQPFIATLAGMWFARGMCFVISDDAIPINNRLYQILGRTKLLIPGLSDPVTQQGAYISILVVLELVVLAVAIYVAHYTRFGRTVYAIGGGNGMGEISARLMGLPVNRTKMLVYTLNGFCSALAGIALSIYVMSGHGLYARTFEMSVIASVVIGGTMISGGTGYVFGTLFGVLITGLIQTLIQFNGTLSSWWTNIVVGLLTLVFIGLQSLLAARKVRRITSKTGQAALTAAEAESLTGGVFGRWRAMAPRSRMLLIGSGALILIAAAALTVNGVSGAQRGLATGTPAQGAGGCELKPDRQDQVETLMAEGAIIVYERNGGGNCIDELFSIDPVGLIVGDNGATQIEKQITPAEVEQLVAAIEAFGWFTDEMYSTSHVPCGQCYTYFLTVYAKGVEKTVKAVDGGTDAPADYWQVVSTINGVIPKFGE